MQPLAVRFLRLTARGPLVEALPAAAAQPASGISRLRNLLLRSVGRLGGLLLTAGMKARVQEWLINRYEIPVNWQPSERLESHFVGSWSQLIGEHGKENLADYLEFGVYQGNSLRCMHRALDHLGLDGVRMFGFDSFEGLPESADLDEIWSEGQFRSDIDLTRSFLDEEGVDWSRTHLIKGFYDQVLSPALAVERGIEMASIIMIDCDLYTSTRDALAFCEPLIRDTSIIYFDDWLSTDSNHGEQRAFREFLGAHPHFQAEPLGGYHEKAEVFRIRRLGA
jgi:hypothetical protein